MKSIAKRNCDNNLPNLYLFLTWDNISHYLSQVLDITEPLNFWGIKQKHEGNAGLNFHTSTEIHKYKYLYGMCWRSTCSRSVALSFLRSALGWPRHSGKAPNVKIIMMVVNNFNNSRRSSASMEKNPTTVNNLMKSIEGDVSVMSWIKLCKWSWLTLVTGIIYICVDRTA